MTPSATVQPTPTLTAIPRHFRRDATAVCGRPPCSAAATPYPHRAPNRRVGPAWHALAVRAAAGHQRTCSTAAQWRSSALEVNPGGAEAVAWAAVWWSLLAESNGQPPPHHPQFRGVTARWRVAGQQHPT